MVDADEDTQLLGSNAPNAPNRVPGKLPRSVWLIALMGACEVATFYGLAVPLQNYIQNSRDDTTRPGAIGLGQATATRVNLVFWILNYITPILGGVIADQYLGRYRTIKYGLFVYLFGLCLLVYFSMRTGEDQGWMLGSLLVAMVFMAFGAGGVKSNTASLAGEQYKKRDEVATSSDGTPVIRDYEMTISRIFMVYYVSANVGGFSSIATTTVEDRFGFGPAFIIPLATLILALAILIWFKQSFETSPPHGSVLLKAFKVLRTAATNGFSFEAAKPHNTESDIFGSWDSIFVDEVKRVVKAWQVFAVFPFYFLAWNQLVTNLISQAGTMETHGIPNDFIFNVGPVTILAMTPILNSLILPFLRSKNIAFQSRARITLGFILIALAMAYAAALQRAIYRSPPCYKHPLQCDGGGTPNKISVALQIPVYALTGLSEIFAVTSGMEVAFTQAPKSMKSLVMALFSLTVACGALLGIVVSPLARDPLLPWLYCTLSIMCLIIGGLFCFANRQAKQ